MTKGFDELKKAYDGITNDSLRMFSALAIAGRLNAVICSANGDMRDGAAALILDASGKCRSASMAREAAEAVGKDGESVIIPEKCRLSEFTGGIGEDGVAKGGWASVAHGRGLWLKEACNYSLSLMQVAGVVCKTGLVTVSRKGVHKTFPASFQMLVTDSLKDAASYKSRHIKSFGYADIIWTDCCAGEKVYAPTFDCVMAARGRLDASFDVKDKALGLDKLKAVLKELDCGTPVDMMSFNKTFLRTICMQ